MRKIVDVDYDRVNVEVWDAGFDNIRYELMTTLMIIDFSSPRRLNAAPNPGASRSSGLSSLTSVSRNQSLCFSGLALSLFITSLISRPVRISRSSEFHKEVRRSPVLVVF